MVALCPSSIMMGFKAVVQDAHGIRDQMKRVMSSSSQRMMTNQNVMVILGKVVPGEEFVHAVHKVLRYCFQSLSLLLILIDPLAANRLTWDLTSAMSGPSICQGRNEDFIC